MLGKYPGKTIHQVGIVLAGFFITSNSFYQKLELEESFILKRQNNLEIEINKRID